MTRQSALVISTFQNLLTLVFARKPTIKLILYSDVTTQNVTRRFGFAKTGLSVNDVTVVTGSFVTNTLAGVLSAVQFFAANFFATYFCSALDVLLCASTRAFPEKNQV